MLKIGLTGGIGSGKSTASQFFKEFGADLIDADTVTRELCNPNGAAYEAILNHFGTKILTPDKNIDRSHLRDIIFTNKNEKKALEDILHPLVRKRIAEKFSTSTSSYCIAVIPLLIENGEYHQINRICVIDTPVALQIERSMLRDNVSKSQIELITQCQASREKRLKVADDILVNDSTRENLKNQVFQLHTAYLSLSKQLL